MDLAIVPSSRLSSSFFLKFFYFTKGYMTLQFGKLVLFNLVPFGTENGNRILCYSGLFSVPFCIYSYKLINLSFLIWLGQRMATEYFVI